MIRDLKRQVMDLLAEGRTPREIRQTIKVSPSYISSCREQLGIPRFHKGRLHYMKQHPREAVLVIILLKRGYTPRQIMNLVVGATYQRIALCRKFIGMKPHRRGPERNETKHALVAQMKRDGLTDKQIANVLGCTRQRVQQMKP